MFLLMLMTRARAAAACVGIAAATAVAASSGCQGGSGAVSLGGACAAPIDLDGLSVCDKAGWCATEPIAGARPVVAVHGAAPDDVWFAVGTTLLHWNGTTTSVIYDESALGPIVDVLEAAPDDLWIVPPTDAPHPFVVRLHAGVAEDVPVPLTSVTSVAGTGPNDVWFGGAGGAAHWDGAAMTLAARDLGSNASSLLTGVGVAGGDVWAIATDSYAVSCPAGVHGCPPGVQNGAVLHRNGTSWDTVTTSQAPATDLLVLGPDDAWTTNGKIGGDSWPSWATAIGGSSDADVWGLTGASLVHWDGSARVTVPGPTTAPLSSIYVAPAGWGVVGDVHGGVHRREGNTFVPMTRAFDDDGYPSIWGTGPDDIFATGEDIAHFDGCTWTRFEPFGPNDPLAPLPAPPNLGTAPRRATVGGAGHDVWIATNTKVLAHRSAAGWERVDTPAPSVVRSIWGASEDDVWFTVSLDCCPGSALPVLFHWDGAALSSVTPPILTPGHFRESGDVTGTAADDVWVSFEYPAGVIHWDGQAWTEQPAPPGNALWALRAAGREDVWASTSNGIFHFDGAGWSQRWAPGGTFAAEVAPLAIWANAPNDVWFGDNLHWDGATMSVTRRSAVDFYAAGMPGAFGAPDPAVAVWGDGHRIWAVGRGEVVTHAPVVGATAPPDAGVGGDTSVPPLLGSASCPTPLAVIQGDMRSPGADTSVVYDGPWAYLTSAVGGGLFIPVWRAPLAGGPPTMVREPSMRFAFTEANDELFWSDNYNLPYGVMALYEQSANGGPLTELTRGKFEQDLLVSGGRLWWWDEGAGGLFSIPTTGGTARNDLATTEPIAGFTVAGDDLYWQTFDGAGASSARLHHRAVDGATVDTLDQMNVPRFEYTDASNLYLLADASSAYSNGTLVWLRRGDPLVPANVHSTGVTLTNAADPGLAADGATAYGLRVELPRTATPAGPTSYVVERIDLATNVATPLVTSSDRIGSLHVDATKLYWTEIAYPTSASTGITRLCARPK